MNAPLNTLAQVRRDMRRHITALAVVAGPASTLVALERRARISEMSRQVARMEATIAVAQARGGV